MCASDINGDGTVNVIDVISVINIIFDRRSLQTRFESVEEIDVIISNDKLEIISEGVLRGVQITIESDSEELMFNENLSMDISYNKVDNKHHILIYGLYGNYIDSGKHTLFESDDSYRVIEFIAANSNNNIVACSPGAATNNININKVESSSSSTSCAPFGGGGGSSVINNCHRGENFVRSEEFSINNIITSIQFRYCGSKHFI